MVPENIQEEIKSRDEDITTLRAQLKKTGEDVRLRGRTHASKDQNSEIEKQVRKEVERRMKNLPPDPELVSQRQPVAKMKLDQAEEVRNLQFELTAALAAEQKFIAEADEAKKKLEELTAISTQREKEMEQELHRLRSRVQKLEKSSEERPISRSAWRLSPTLNVLREMGADDLDDLEKKIDTARCQL